MGNLRKLFSGAGLLPVGSGAAAEGVAAVEDGGGVEAFAEVPGGDLGAAKLLVDRVCGKPAVSDELNVVSSPATSPATSAATADNSSGEPTDEPASLQQRRAKMAARIQALSH